MLEIDAATHTQVDNVREVIIAGLSIVPVRDRYKVFIIDEVHQLSSSSFNALLKSVEEPPPHVVFIMATTLLDKIPDTILSRSQVFEFRTIGTAAIAEQLRTIVEAEQVSVDEAGLALVARTANGSMRDAESALDQVIAFAGDSAGAADVSAVLGLVGRDAVLEMAETVAAETAERVFDLAGRFVEAGYDLRSVCRELARLVRDLMVLKVDPRRISDPEIALDAERDRLQALVDRFSREDLLRGFDVLSRAELDIRNATQPRYHFEMAMLRWIHLRALVPLTDLLGGGGRLEPAPPPAAPAGRRPAPAGSPPQHARPAPQARRTAAPAPAASARPEPSPGPPAGSAPAASAPEHATGSAPAASAPEHATGSAAAASAPEHATGSAAAASAPDHANGSAANLKERFLAELQRTKKFFHGTVAAQAWDIEVESGQITFVFTTAQRTLAQQVEKSRSWLEPLAGQVAGQKTAVTVRRVDGAAPRGAGTASGGPETGPDLHQPALTTLPPEPPPPTEPPADLELSVDREPPALGSPVQSEPPAGRAASPEGSPVESGFLTSPEGAAPPAGRGSSPLGSPVRSGAPPAAEPPPERAPSSLGPPVQSGSAAPLSEKTGDLLSQAMDDPAVQTLLDVFPAEIKQVEEM